ncbi:MAG: methyltransferase domain-containing protein [Deltaproteobacteria bacterium]|nr:methyltransferase domain-containing protein [Deltaproteobacteria bacterium]
MQRSLDKEMMDLPGISESLLEEDLTNLRTINRYLGAYRGLLRCLDGLAKSNGTKTLSLLDVGTGTADMLVEVIRWARKNEISANAVGLESNPITARLARVHTEDVPEISIVVGDAFCPPFPPASFDFVFSSQILHHFSEAEIIELLNTWSGFARCGILVSDLVRHPLAYLGIGVLTRLFTRNPMTLMDAPLSVRRAFTIREWQNLFKQATVNPVEFHQLFPFRIFARLELRK